jgi:hypothetical protein
VRNALRVEEEVTLGSAPRLARNVKTAPFHTGMALSFDAPEKSVSA